VKFIVNLSNSRLQKGFTLIELVLVIVIIGVVSIILSPVFSALTSSQKGAYNEKQKINNQLIASGLLNFARYSSTLGSLPSPYSSLPSIANAIYNPGDTSVGGMAIATAITQTGINPREINDDGFNAQRVRVYQLVTGLTQQIPLYFQSGPLVTVAYQFGAIYQTACERSAATCNPSAGTGIPGDSLVLTSTNFSTWTTTGTDSQPNFVSNLPLQKQMLASTNQRLDKIRDALVGYLRAQQNQASATDTTNWFPTEVSSLGGASPGTNQGCRDGWYSLASGTVILPTVGLGTSEFGATAWGGVIQYCRDFDPTGVKVPNASPHYGAVRINKNVSLGIPPDSVTASNNIVLTF
jgi:prepilin-type N-terminal cleavage/methylation domain-containing protein